MIQGIYDFPDVVSGDTVQQTEFEVKIDSVALDLTGAEIKMAFSDLLGNVKKKFITPAEIIITDAVNGKFKIASYIIDIPAQTYNHDIQIKILSGTIKTYIKGQIKVLPEIAI